ncbi:MAG TPA: hypothetical protein VN253_04175 [Kofleriaceae bacterium]|nr:hypothetical protein [Kofleriaceae bacterium]
MIIAHERPVEHVTLHFDLRHCPPEAEHTLRALGVRYRLERHTAETRRAHAARNAALAIFPPGRLAEITHYAEDVALPSEAVGMYRVGYPSASPAALLPEIAVCFRHVPTAARRRWIAHRLERDGRGVVPAVLARFGIAELPREGAADAILDASRILTPFSSAQSLLQSHPDLASPGADTQAVVEAWVGEALRGVGSSFVTYLSENGPGTATPWYTQTVAENQDGTPMTPNPSLKDKHGAAIPWPTQDGQPVIAQYTLSTGVLGDGATPGAIAPALNWVLQQTKNEPRLNGQLWTTQHGITSTRRTQVSPVTSAARPSAARPSAARAADDTSSYNWALSFLTSQYGVQLDQAPPVWDDSSQTISFKLSNWANRCLGVYVQFIDASGAPIDNPSNWVEQLPYLAAQLEPSSSKKYLAFLFSGNTFFGGPVLNGWTTLSFPVPDDAVKAEVLLGGLGIGPFDMDVDIPGIIGTVVLSYAIPSFLLALSVGGNFNKWFQSLSADDQTFINLVLAFVPTFVAMFAGNVTVGEMLDSIGEGVIGFLLSSTSAAVEKLAARLIAYATGEEVADSVPVVGWALKVASVASTVADLIATTVEVCKSPATYDLEITRSIAVSATVSPDPTHAAPGQDPIWPAVATSWTATVQHQGGTYATQTGAMPSTNDQALQIDFPTIPAAPGDSIQVVVSIYSDTQWLAGQWSSSWVPAVATSGTTLTLSGSIIESLVPLTANTQYSHLQKLSYDSSAGAHVWDQTTTAPTETASSTDCNSTSTLCTLTGITINDAAYAVGYAYRAGGQGLPLDSGDTPSDAQMYAFQSISVLTNPETGMKAPTLGFSVQPSIAYDQFGPAPLFTIPDTFLSELDGGGAAGADLMSAFSAAGSEYALPAGTQITVVTASAEWYLGLAAATPLYDLRREVDVIQVFPYPTPAVSPRNFYLDPRSVSTTGSYYLRQVTLDDGSSTFDYTEGQSFGTFSFPNSNPTAMAVHPNGYVVTIDYVNSKLQILELASAPVADASAPAAQPASGAGSREGLMSGPVAMAVTPDGRILVLEQGNARIQAFDVVGNPVQTFAGPLQFALATTFQGDLDDASSSTALVQAYQAAVAPPIAPCGTLPKRDATSLDAGTVPGDLVEAFQKIGISLSSSLAVSVVQAGSIWLLQDQTSGTSFDLRLAESGADLEVRPAPALSIEVVAAGSEWLVRDTVNTLTFLVQPDSQAGNLAVQQLVATFALEDPIGSPVTYLDVAVETKSFIYVLSYENASSGETLTPASYRLDIYNPDGTWLARTPDQPGAAGVTGAHMTVDQWRNLYTLNYEAFQGPNGRTEPSVSTWIPSTPGSAT